MRTSLITYYVQLASEMLLLGKTVDSTDARNPLWIVSAILLLSIYILPRLKASADHVCYI